MSDKIYASKKENKSSNAHNVSDVEVKERKCGLGVRERVNSGLLDCGSSLVRGRAIETSWNDGAATLRGPYPSISNQLHQAVARGKTA